MNRCLSCNELCEATAIFCDSCRASLLNRQQKRDESIEALPRQAEYAEIVEQTQNNAWSQACSIEKLAIDSHPQMYLPSHLPLLPTSKQNVDLNQFMPGVLSEEEETDRDQRESDGWIHEVDPLITRHLPTSTAAIYNNEENIPLQTPNKQITLPLPVVHRRPGPLRIALITFVIVIALALIVDAVFISSNVVRQKNVNFPTAPVMIVSPDIAHPGQMVLLHINQFSPSTHVLLTRDIQDKVHTDTGTSIIALGSTGSADVHILIEKSWGMGSHTIEGEDLKTHYTSSTTIQVIATGQTPGTQPTSSASPTSGTPGGTPNGTTSGTTTSTTPPPGEPILNLSTSNLTFTYTQGQRNPGGQSASLANVGPGVLFWQASIESSASSWLSIDPNGGTISASQSAQIQVSISPSQLLPGQYKTKVTVNASDSSGTQLQGSPLTFTVVLTVFAPCSLQITPSSLTFKATLLGSPPPGQDINLKETGNCTQPVSWSVTANRNWVTFSHTNGTGNTSITVHVSAQGMLLGTYSAQITLSASGNIPVNPQTIPVTLTVNA